MKILFFGAGIIGSVYAARLTEAKNDVTLLARGSRYNNLKTNGIALKNCISGTQIKLHVPLVTSLKENDFYDLVIVTVRLDQLDEVIPVLKKNNVIKNVMFMMNIPAKTAFLSNILNSKNITLGFPGIGGTEKNNIIEYIDIKQQKTTIGAITGNGSILLNDIKAAFESANFIVAICNDMQSWLNTHAIFISCISAAIFEEHSDPVQLAKKRWKVKMMVQSIREGFSALKAINVKILPSNLNLLFMKMPRWFATWYWQKALRGETGTLAIAPHVKAAANEIKLIAAMALHIVHASPLATSTLDKLLQPFLKKENTSL
jgi:2-dehydropantoate 2-reductase